MFVRGLPLACLLAVASTAHGEAWDPPMHGDPKAILTEVRRQAPPAGSDFETVFRDVTVTIGTSGEATTSVHTLTWVLTARGARYSESYDPGNSRVIGTDGALHAATLVDPAGTGRQRHMSLRSVPVGSVIETWTDGRCECTSGAIAAWGRESLEDAWPSRRTRITIVHPAASRLQVTLSNVKMLPLRTAREKANGWIRETWDVSATPGIRSRVRPTLEYSTAASWKAIGQEWFGGFERLVEAAPHPALRLPARTYPDVATTAASLIRDDFALVAGTGDQSSIAFSGAISRSPEVTLSTPIERATSADFAALVAAQLRALGISADPVLVFDPLEKLPGPGSAVLLHLPGSKPEWLDVSDRFQRPGQLPEWMRGARVLFPGGKAPVLLELPPSPATDLDVREIFAAESGGARVVDTEDISGGMEAYERGDLYRDARSDDPDDRPEGRLQGKTLVSYDQVEPEDLTRSFHRRTEVTGSSIAFTVPNDHIIVEVGLGYALIPLQARLWTRDRDETGMPASDVRLDDPLSQKREVIIHVPPGFRPKDLQAGQVTRTFGCATWTRETRLHEDIVEVEARLDVVPGVISKDEARDLLTFAQDSWKDDNLTFESIAKADVAAGNPEAGIAELRRLILLHPAEAVHHDDLATMLVEAGLGEDARKEAHRAVELEPRSGEAWRYLGWILEHDSFGRADTRAADHAGAVDANRRALEIDPDDAVAHRQLGMLLLHDPTIAWEGARVAPQVAEGIEELRKARRSPSERVDGELAAFLLWTRRFDELLDPSLSLKADEQVEAARLVAIALGSGEAGVREEQASKPLAARSIRLAFNDAMRIREYPTASLLYRLDAEAAGMSRTYRPLADLYAGIRKVDFPTPDSPRGIALRAMVLVMSIDAEADDVEPLLAESARTGGLERLRRGALLTMTRFFTIQGWALPRATTADVVLSCSDVVVDGDDAQGWRVKVTIKAPDTGTGEEVPHSITWFVVKEGKEYRLLDPDRPEPAIGDIAFSLVKKKDVRRAAVWLDRVRDFIADPARPASTSTDPLARSLFPLVWQTSGDAGLSAATLVRKGENLAPAMEVVKKGRAAATSPVLATALDLALAWQLGAADRSEDLVGVARRLEASDPQSATAFAIESSALDASGRYEEAIAGARARLDAHPGEPEAIRALGMSLALSGRIDEGLTEFRHVLDGRSPTSVDYNQLAWLGLLAGSNLERALADATKSTRKLPTSAGYHTLAAIQAERGHFAEASTSLAWCGWMRGRSEPVNDDFYVLGRIAERLGFADEAVSFYKRVPKSKSAIGTARLCERRLQALKTAP